jgi:hypothetical protein
MGPVLTRGRVVLLAFTVFLSYGYFYQAGGWNQDSRFSMVRAILENGTLKITAYHHITGDKSRIGADYYSDKAPGHALLATPLVALPRAGMKVAGVETTSPVALMWLLYWATLTTASLPACLTMLSFLWVSRRLGASEGGALLGALVVALGTPLFAYATLFWCHALAAALVWGAFTAALALGQGGSRRRDWLLGLAVGLGAGWATISEYPAAVPAVLLSGLALAQVYRDGWPRLLRVAAGIAAGAIPCLLALLAYNIATLGTAFSLAYQHQVNFVSLNESFKLPSGNNLGLSLFGEYRGLLLLAPVLTVAPLAVGMMMTDRRLRSVALICAIVPAYYFLLNASYGGWWGGWCYGPRNTASALPFLALPLTIMWGRTGWLSRVAMLATAIYGMGFAVLATAVTAQPNARVVSPIADLWWANFKAGKFSLFPGAWNWGQRLGLEGHASLAPLLCAWAVAAFGWVALGSRWARRAQVTVANPQPLSAPPPAQLPR